MAGLAGVVDPHFSPNQLQQLLHNMLQSLKSAEWYQVTGRVLNEAGLGRVSLEIMNPGPQPVSNASGEVWVLLDGEIYNTHVQPLKQQLLDQGRQLRTESDTELLLHLYEVCGERFIDSINGTFNVVIWDDRKKKLLIANDRFGTRPFYYSLQPRFCFASEIKAILQQPDLKREVNEEAVIEFLTFRHILGDKTHLNGISILPPATVLSYQSGRVSLVSYWTPSFEPEQPRLAAAEYAEHLLVLLRQAVNRCMSRPQRTGVLLSGGLDSRLLAGLVGPQHFPVDTFTRSIPGCDDARLAQQVADRLGTRHHFLEILPDFLKHQAVRGVWLTDGLMTSVDFYELSTIDRLKQHVDVVCFGIPAGPLGGLGLSRGSFGLDDLQLAERIVAVQGAAFNKDNLPARLLSEPFYRNVKDTVFKNVHQLLQSMPSAPSHIKTQAYYLRYYGPRSALHGPVLTRSMVETCFPFADADFLDLTLKTPGELRIGRGIEIEMLKQGCPELVDIPWQYSGLPVTASQRRIRLERALYRVRKELNWRTRGLVSSPVRKEQVNWPLWFRTGLRSWLEDILLSERALSRGYFSPAGLRELVQDHMSERYDRTILFGRLLTFELWHRLFIDGETPAPAALEPLQEQVVSP